MVWAESENRWAGRRLGEGGLWLPGAPRAKIVGQGAGWVRVDYGCRGQGLVTNYFLLDGVQLCILDFKTGETLPAQTFDPDLIEITDPDLIEITYCRSGRYECEFANHTVSCLPEGCFRVAGTHYLPVNFSFPLERCSAVSLVVDRRNLSDGSSALLCQCAIDLERVAASIGKQWPAAGAGAFV